MENTKEKIWGIYNTFDENYEQLSEIELWQKINNLSTSLDWVKKNIIIARTLNVSAEDLLNIEYNLEYLIYSTKRFGVTFDSEPSAANHIELSYTYFVWFKFWNNHFSSMTSDLRKSFEQDIKNGENLSKYMPTTYWTDYISTPSQKVLN